MAEVKALFLDIGGVLLSNGWDTALRRKTAAHFGVDYEELDHRHRVCYDIYEEGKMPLEEYLRHIIFFEPRPYKVEDVRDFILAQGRAFEDMLELVRELRERHRLQVAVVSNEGREIAEDRIRRFGLREFVDFFIVSAFVHLRKPDEDIYRLALDVAQVSPEQVIYIEDRPLLCEVAAGLGIRAIRHANFAATCAALEAAGLNRLTCSENEN